MLLFASLIASAQKSTGTDVGTRIEGDVVNALTGESIPRASLILRRAEGSSQSPDTQGISADQNGHFEMKGVEPGKYRLFASHVGFVSAEFTAREVRKTGKSLSLSPGQPLDGLVFRLMPQSVITGRLTDEHGDPIPLAQIQAVGYRYNRGQRQMASFGAASTNDLGEYRIFGLPPGRYYVRAAFQQNVIFQSTADGVESQEYIPTYYPHGTDPGMASLVDTKPGAQITGLDFALSRVPAFHIRGTVSSKFPGGLATLRLAPANVPELPELHQTFTTDSKGNFDIHGVLPGNYTLVASEFTNGLLLTAKASVEVGDHSEAVNLTLVQPLSLSGSIQTEGGHTVNLTSIHISLQTRQSAAPMGPPPFVAPNGDGTFSLSPVIPDSYFVTFTGLPDGYYVKAVKFGNEDVLESGLDLHPDSTGLITVVLSPGAGRIDGTVVDDQGQPAPGATVVLIPQEESRKEQDRFYRIATADDKGNFTIKNVDIGKFKVFAWQDVESDAWMDPAFVKPFESRSEAITVHENVHLVNRILLMTPW